MVVRGVRLVVVDVRDEGWSMAAALVVVLVAVECVLPWELAEPTVASNSMPLLDGESLPSFAGGSWGVAPGCRMPLRAAATSFCVAAPAVAWPPPTPFILGDSVRSLSDDASGGLSLCGAAAVLTAPPPLMERVILEKGRF